MTLLILVLLEWVLARPGMAEGAGLNWGLGSDYWSRDTWVLSGLSWWSDLHENNQCCSNGHGWWWHLPLSRKSVYGEITALSFLCSWELPSLPWVSVSLPGKERVELVIPSSLFCSSTQLCYLKEQNRNLISQPF